MVGQGQNEDSYVSRLHVVGVVTLAVLTVGLGLTGWALRPPSSGFPSLPGNMIISIEKAPSGLNFVEMMEPLGDGGGVLTLSAKSDFAADPPSVPEGPWMVTFDGLGQATVCSPHRYSYMGSPTVRVPPQRILRYPELGRKEFRGATGIEGNGPFYIRLCWQSNGPVARNGAYLNAQFPVLYVDAAGDPQAVPRYLDLGSPDVPDYASESSLQSPTSATQGGWQWAPRVSLVDRISVPLSFSAVNTSETQHDTYETFLSGIVFGLAGGALIALVQEFVAPFRTRKELRPPEPGG